MSDKTKRVVFFHPDLGIGGAERLVVDAAVGLQDLGYKVTIFTSHCDSAHCFDEARDGTLDVRVRGNTLVPPSLLGRFSILCAVLRQVHLILQIAILTAELRQLQPDVFFVDQLSAGVPLLRLFSPAARVLFYCHFPDKLLAQRESQLKAAYRVPFDMLESWSTGCSDTIVVNSNFTKSVFKQAFPGLKARDPGVVYPCVDTRVSEQAEEVKRQETPLWAHKKAVFLSINRFERKKDIGLAIRAYAGLSPSERETSRLVIAGGYDARVPENAAYHASLTSLADSLSLKSATVKNVITALSVPDDIDVLFLLSIPASLKATLLASARLLLYTPRHEHFGIVPLEAMLAGTPVLAANEGGPLETVVDDETGWLRDVSEPEAWTAVMRKVLDEGGVGRERLEEMGRAGQRRVKAEFSKEMMACRLQGYINAMPEERPPIVDAEAFKLLVALVGGLAAFTAIKMFS